MILTLEAGRYQLRLIESVEQIGQQQWQQLAGSQHPFCDYRFLRCLEQSAAVNGDSGFLGRHACLYHDDQLRVVLLLWQKNHSRGEYVFDHSWAHAWQQQGMRYYPKWISAIPYTPISGPRVLYLPQAQSDIPRLLQMLLPLMQQNRVSGLHLLFADDASREQLQAGNVEGICTLQRHDVQFHWFNRGYQQFDDFLAQCRSSKRKQIRRERQRLHALQIRRLGGKEMSSAQWQQFYRCYANTYYQRGMHPYLSADFFTRLATDMSERLMVVEASYQGQALAYALNLFDKQHLYGRYWGCLQEIDGLHFECCYYQGIEFCIEQGLSLFNAGAQGEHKLARGFEPVITRSTHWMQSSVFDQALQRFCAEEQHAVQHYAKQTALTLPYHRNESTD